MAAETITLSDDDDDNVQVTGNVKRLGMMKLTWVHTGSWETYT